MSISDTLSTAKARDAYAIVSSGCMQDGSDSCRVWGSVGLLEATLESLFFSGCHDTNASDVSTTREVERFKGTATLSLHRGDI